MLVDVIRLVIAETQDIAAGDYKKAWWDEIQLQLEVYKMVYPTGATAMAAVKHTPEEKAELKSAVDALHETVTAKHSEHVALAASKGINWQNFLKIVEEFLPIILSFL